MSLALVTAFALDGVDSRRVWVEADTAPGLPAFTIAASRTRLAPARRGSGCGPRHQFGRDRARSSGSR